MRTDLIFSPATSFRADTQPVTHEVVAYLGPKNYRQLVHADEVSTAPGAEEVWHAANPDSRMATTAQVPAPYDDKRTR